MMPPLKSKCSTESPKSALSLTGKGALLGCAALLVFAAGLYSKAFADEYAYLSQSYYFDLATKGQVHNVRWLDFPAWDLQPLPKYLIGLSLHLSHVKLRSRGDALNWYRFYGRYGDERTLMLARLPSVALGALGVLAIFGCGILIKDRRAGVVAAALLIINPLYRLHAHRAMSDVPCEALSIAALAAFLWAGVRIWRGSYRVPVFLATALAGIAAGGSLLCKFNGFLALMIMGGWCAATWLVPGLPVVRKLAIGLAGAAAVIIALALSVALNPYYTARPPAISEPLPTLSLELFNKSPWERFVFQVKHRVGQSDDQKGAYPNDALYTLAAKAKVVLVQGFGRFGPFGPSASDSTKRFSTAQDWGMALWLPCVLIGLVEALRLGCAQLRGGEPPLGIALLIWAGLGWIVVGAYLPMAWDRYLLPIQSGNALLAALSISAIYDRILKGRAQRREGESAGGGCEPACDGARTEPRLPNS
jgi:4-amino-4-deoxy-L-arabinose transferase-like glycosyltransferase